MSTDPPATTTGGEAPKFDAFSKENRWYYKELNDHLHPASRRLLENYCGIAPEDIDDHVLKMRDSLWSSAPYPCIGEFKFLNLNLPKHPLYTHILFLLKPTTAFIPSLNEPQGPFLLDLGCCVAQELRSLTSVGIPSSSLYGSDINPNFLTKSYDLFKDAPIFNGTLVPADIFSPTLFEDAFFGWENKFKVIHTGLFFHLFDWQRQLVICERIIKMLESGKGALFVGETVGCKTPGERTEGKDKHKRVVYLHDAESFKKLWAEVATKTGTEEKWRVEANLAVRREQEGKSKVNGPFFQGEGIGRLNFSVERI